MRSFRRVARESLEDMDEDDLEGLTPAALADLAQELDVADSEAEQQVLVDTLTAERNERRAYFKQRDAAVRDAATQIRAILREVKKTHGEDAASRAYEAVVENPQADHGMLARRLAGGR